jgi:hypothetical protein
MTEFPALRDALVGAAARRRRRRRVAGAAAPTFAVAAVALVALVTASHEPRERERAVASPAPAVGKAHVPRSVEAAFAVFRREATRADRLPAGVVFPGMGSPSATRFLKQGGPRRFFAASFATREGTTLCLLALRRGRIETKTCGTPTEAIGEPTPLRISAGDVTGVFLPDTSTDLRFILSNGVGSVSPSNNLSLVQLMAPLAGLSWTGGSGMRYIEDFGGTRAPAAPPPDTCPKSLEPLPPDALTKARRAALIAVDRFYPSAMLATVVSANPATGTPCSSPITGRSIDVGLRLVPRDPKQRKSDSLSQGRLLLGMQDGYMRVFYLLH